MAHDATAALHMNDRNQVVLAWFDTYHVALFRYLVRLLGDDESAADLVQDTFVRALRRLNPAQPPPNPATWLYRIATNLAYDALRRRRRWRWLPLRDDLPASAFESSVATAQAVRQCLARLRPAEAEVLLLFEYAGLSGQEIATVLQVDVTTVRVRVHRARVRFRTLYQKELSG